MQAAKISFLPIESQATNNYQFNNDLNGFFGAFKHFHRHNNACNYNNSENNFDDSSVNITRNYNNQRNDNNQCNNHSNDKL